jgi:hypothetical protein
MAATAKSSGKALGGGETFDAVYSADSRAARAAMRRAEGAARLGEEEREEPSAEAAMGGRGQAAEDNIIAALGLPKEFIYGGFSAMGSGIASFAATAGLEQTVACPHEGVQHRLAK